MARYERILTDKHTGEQAIIKANHIHLFEEKMNRKIDLWNKRAVRTSARNAKDAAKAYKESKIEEAAELTEEATAKIDAFNSVLTDTLKVDDKIKWENLLNKTPFRSFTPQDAPIHSQFMKSVPQKSFWELLWPPMKTKRLELEKKAKGNYEDAVKNHQAQMETEKSKWQVAKTQYEQNQTKSNQEVLELKRQFEESAPDAIEKYVEMVMDNSSYPDGLDLSCDVHFVADRKTLLIDLDLPNPESFPIAIEYKYAPTKDDFTVKEMKKKDSDVFYESVIAQVVVRTIHEIFEAVYTNAIDFVTLNGWVNGTDPKTGQDFRNCIVSVQSERESFRGLNLGKVEPIQCLRGLKAQIASEFVNLAPVKPILQLDRNDKRIIASEDVIDSLDNTTNLANMDWQKFEQLVRDLFEKEFSGDGVEVKVTQASRDAGVDAIVFDPDPIKGGKFVIQAKRYNNVVGVSAVRDLYGTMMNEGAVKGILVTTSNFGKDSIEFATGKPLTLISGSELIYLFNKHGYKVNIETTRRPTRQKQVV
jgi:restriction system protein